MVAGIVEDSLVVEEGIMVKFPLVPFATWLLHLQSSYFKVLSTKKKLDSHIVEIRKDPTS